MTAPLKGDESRQAVSPMRGYQYQILRSIYEWIDLSSGERLFLEGAEDFDRVSGDSAQTTQVKHTETTANLTLRSSGARDALDNFWELRAKNPGLSIRLNFLTTANIGVEAGNPFGSGRPGLQLWDEAAAPATDDQTLKKVNELKQFLLADDPRDARLRQFLASASLLEIKESLIDRVKWMTGQLSLGDVEAEIIRKLSAMCWDRRVPAAYAPKILDRLVKVAWDTAIRASDRSLSIEDFYRVFDEVTTVPVPRAEYDALAAGINSMLMSSAGGKDPQLQFSSSSVRVGSAPPLFGQHLRRVSIEKNVLAELNNSGVALLHGATGTGKSMQATMFAQDEPGAFVWVNCRDAVPIELRMALADAGRRLDAHPECRYVVLDDADMNVHEKALEEATPGLLYTLRRRKGGLIFTAHRPLSQRLQTRLAASSESNIVMPPFEVQEISELLRLFGAQDAQRVEVWAKLILAKTSGHPQLVAARVAALAQYGFQAPKAKDLLSTPRDIADAREQARLVVSTELPANQRELLYRLSLLTTSFSRARVHAIAEIAPVLDEAGNAFDHVVGPWIERPTTSEFRLSPLLIGAGSDVNGPVWTQAMHASIADAWLRFREQSPWDVATILFSAAIGGNMLALLRLSIGLNGASDEVWESLSQTCVFFPLFYTGVGQHFPAKNPYEAFCARWLQLQIAARSSPETSQIILDRVDDELSLNSQEADVQLLRHMFLLQTLSLRGTVVTPTRLIGIIAEIVEGRRVFTESFRHQAQDAGVDDQEEIDRIESTDLGPAFGVALIMRINSCEALAELILLLGSLRPETRAECLSLFKAEPDMARQFADGIWLTEHQSPTPRWPLLANTLGDLCKHALLWGEVALAQGVASVRARILHEQLSDETGAIAALEAVPMEGPASYLLLDIRAKILLDQGDYQRALAIWRGVFAQWKGDASANVVAFALAARNAGIAAAKANDWRASAEFFETAAEAASNSDNHRLTVGLAADAAYAWFRANSRIEALRCAERALRGLAAIPNSSGEIRNFYLHKVIGHVFSWMAQKARWVKSGLDEPTPGACSNLDPSDKILAMGPTPIALTQSTFLGLVQVSGQKLSEFDELANSAFSSGVPLARYQVIDFRFNESLDNGDTTTVVSSVVSLLAELAALRREDQLGEGGQQASDASTSLDVGKSDPGYWVLYLCKGLLAVAEHSQSVSQVLARWRTDLVRENGPNDVVRWLESLETIVRAPIGEKLRVMDGSATQWASRVAVAAMIFADKSADPRALVRAHATLLMLEPGMLSDHLKLRACAAASAAWRLATKRRSVLKNPDSSVAIILEACEANGDPTAKLARIFLAALLAVDMPIPGELKARASAIAQGDEDLKEQNPARERS